MNIRLSGLIILIISITVNLKLQAQAVHDAFELHSFLNDSMKFEEGSSPEKLYQLLAENLDNEQKNPTRDEIIDAYKDNPFIAPLIGDNLGGPKEFSGTIGSRSIDALAGASTGLGLPASTFLMGLTDFLVKRTKQELTIAFFRDFQKILKESEEMKYLFPSTTKVLMRIGEDIYQFKAFWEVLRESFMKDLNDLVYNLDNYVQNSTKIKSDLQRHIMSDFFKVTELFYDKKTPADIINYLSEDAFLHTIDPDTDSTLNVQHFQSSLKVLGILSRSFESEDANGYWADPEKVVAMIKKPIIANIYLGLLYQQSKNIKMGDKTLAAHIATLKGKGNGEKAKRLLNTFKAFLDKAKSLQRLARDMRGKQNERRRNKNAAPMSESDKVLQYDEYFEFTQGVCELILYAYDFKKELTGSTNMQDSMLQQYLSIIGDINNIALNIRKKQYTTALMNTLFSIEKLLPADEFACERKILLKYGTFIATAAKAKTAEEVSNVIAAFALPPGGSAIKKYSKFSIALNAYVGISGGQEILNGIGAKPYYAVTTPIGFSFNWGFKNYGSFSILASFMDIGALTAYRFEDNNVSELPDLKFENVLAPGGYLVYGFPKYPVSIGIGAQMGPNLRTVTNGNLGLSNTNGWRWGAFLAVDLPIVSVYSSNKNYKQCCKKCKKKK